MSKEDEGMMGETIDTLWCEFRFVCEGVNYLKHWHVTKLAILSTAGQRDTVNLGSLWGKSEIGC